MKKYRFIFLTAFPLFLASCMDETGRIVSSENGHSAEIKVQAEIDQTNVSRADDSGFADGDKIGVFAVSFIANNNPGTLAPSGNLANNVRYVLNAASNDWVGDRQLYFPDDKTPVDFYGYYPYDVELNEVTAYPFSVERNQQTEALNGKLAGYEASDFLWAKSAGVNPSSPVVNLTFRHLLSGVQVSLIEGEGFDEGEWTKIEKSVLLANTNRNSTINLSNGIVTPVGQKDNNSIIMNSEKDYFRAVVIPQTVGAQQSLLLITVDGVSYDFKKQEDMSYISGKLHKFTLQVNKDIQKGDYDFLLIDEAITAWESDLTSHDGKVKEYVVVDGVTKGNLENAVKASGLIPSETINLKIKGEMNDQDFAYLRENFKFLEALNLKEVAIRDCQLESESLEDNCLPQEACKGMRFLKTVVFPETLKKIGSEAFRNTNLTGSLDLPEGLEYIGLSAFSNWQGYSDSNTNLSGTLTLPSTLKYIGDSAFENCDFTGSLVLPEGLETLGENAFADCKGFSGELHLPSSLRNLGRGAFAKTNFSGNFTIPHHLTKIEAFFFPKIVNISWPEHTEEICDEAFWNTSLNGDIRVPETVTHIGRNAFCGTKISHIAFPQNLEFIESNVCSWNKFLQDTVVIPPLIETIGESAFSNCEKLDAVVLPKKLQRIKGSAFENCFSLTYIHCQAIEPPVLEESAFFGVNKDNFTVEVPEESVDAYRNAPGWREFKRIAAYKNFVARPSKYNVLNKGGKKEIILNADSDWEMTECPSWCHVDKTSGSKKTVINLTVDEMSHDSAPRNGSITFRLKGADGYLTHINVGQYDYEYDEDSYLQLQKATKGKGVDIVLLGDGYDAIDISSGLYLKDMRQEMEYMFAVEPYTTYREYFNVYTAFPLSEDSGVETLNTWRTTKFHAKIGDGETRLSADWVSALNYCADNVSPVVNKADIADIYVGVLLLCNTECYEGVTNLMENAFCAVVTKSTLDYPNDARGLVQHEACGHGFGRLADEYIYHQAFIQKCKCVCCGHLDDLLERQSIGFGLNLSINGKYKEVPWSHLIFHKNYSDIVDVFEGGFFHSRGVYRSEYNSCMNNNVPYFSSWSRELIVRNIMKIAGEEFDLESFYAKDSRSVGRDFTSTSRSGVNQAAVNGHKGQAPVIIKNYKFGKKGGKR